MTQLSCGCTVPFDPDEPDERYCAVWYEWEETWDDAYQSFCYGTLCDDHLSSYQATRCKLGGESL